MSLINHIPRELVNIVEDYDKGYALEFIENISDILQRHAIIHQIMYSKKIIVIYTDRSVYIYYNKKFSMLRQKQYKDDCMIISDNEVQFSGEIINLETNETKPDIYFLYCVKNEGIKYYYKSSIGWIDEYDNVYRVSATHLISKGKIIMPSFDKECLSTIISRNREAQIFIDGPIEGNFHRTYGSNYLVRWDGNVFLVKKREL